MIICAIYARFVYFSYLSFQLENSMKRIAFLLIIVFFSSCGDDEKFDVDCLPTGLKKGVVAFYPFSDSDLIDQSKGDNILENETNASPTSDRVGNSNCAYSFNNSQGDEQFLTTSNTSFLNNLSTFSVSLWYEPLDTTRDLGIYETLLSRGLEGRCPNRRGEWSIGLFDCRRAVFGHNNSVWADLVTPSSVYEACQEEVFTLTNTWHHVAVTKNGDTFKIYFDGILNAAETGNANCTSLHLAQDIGDFFIGKGYTGNIDDVIIYDREISATEVDELFTLDVCCQ